MAELEETGALLDGILAVTHPELYDAGRKLMHRLYCEMGAASRELVDAWPSVYHAVHIIVNRATVYHRDTNGLPGWYDMLVSVGDYGEEGVLSLKSLGASIPYDSGTVVLICSRIISHGAPVVPPDRICYAWLMKEDVLAHYDAGEPGWSTLSGVGVSESSSM